MIKKYILDMLTENSVTVRTQNYTVVGDDEYPIGGEHWRAYVNTDKGRQEVENELLVAQKNAVFAVWGDEPTVEEFIAE